MRDFQGMRTQIWLLRESPSLSTDWLIRKLCRANARLTFLSCGFSLEKSLHFSEPDIPHMLANWSRISRTGVRIRGNDRCESSLENNYPLEYIKDGNCDIFLCPLLGPAILLKDHGSTEFTSLSYKPSWILENSLHRAMDLSLQPADFGFISDCWEIPIPILPSAFSPGRFV